MSTKSSIEVCIKLRPCDRESASVWQVKGPEIHLADSQAERYVFDHVFNQDATNQEVFDRMAKHIVHACMQGFNGTIFAYGQTSSGKTYTMMGNNSNPGVMVLAAKEIFQYIKQNKDREFLLRVGYIEIYNEKMYDLLDKKNHELKIHETSTGVVSVNSKEFLITSEKCLLDLLSMGNKERTVGETNMNERSSRSHAVFRIIIESRKTDRTEDAVNQSQLNLVDLAGSERADLSGARGARLKEGGHINKSLLFLSNVIKHLSENIDNKFISFRDSKLTRILQASLGGNALTSIICTIKPTVLEESQSTLQFATRAKRIRLKPIVNEFVSDATMMKRLEKQIQKLSNDYEECKKESQLAVSKKESELKQLQLQAQVQEHMLKIISSRSLKDQMKRRRTWCSTLNSDANGDSGATDMEAVVLGTTGKPVRSLLPKPTQFPMLRSLNPVTPRCTPIFESLNVGTSQEEFVSSENFNFMNTPGGVPQTPRNPKKSEDFMALTPATLPPEKALELVEKDLKELQSFTNMEKEMDVNCDPYKILKEKFDIVNARCDELEAQRLINLKRELSSSNDERLSNGSCDECQSQIVRHEEEVKRLTTTIARAETEHSESKKRIELCEKEVVELRATVARLEVENREAVDLEFQFTSHKTKAKQREAELLKVLEEKDVIIAKLKHTNDELRNAAFLNTKEARMQSIYVPKEAVCNNCVDLERLQKDHDSMKIDFQTLTEEYQKLQTNFHQVTEESTQAQMRLNELEQLNQLELAQSEQLRAEIASIRMELESVQDAYKQVSSEKAEVSARLNNDVLLAQERMLVLQEKCDRLETNRKQQQQAIEEIQQDYDAIQQKYQSLQAEYEKMEQSTVNSKDLCVRLQQENTDLQTEIIVLKQRVEEAQKQLLEAQSNDSVQLPASSESIASELQQINSELREKVKDLERRFNELQCEYDDLSTQLLESVQEGDALRQLCSELRSELCTQSEITSTASSEAVFDSQAEARKQQFADLVKSLRKIEFQHHSGTSIFHANATSNETTTKPPMKLCFQSIGDIVLSADTSATCLNPGLIGLLREHKFEFVETLEIDEPEINENNCAVDELRREIEEKNGLIDSTEQTIQEMRKQMEKLKSALLEKSIIVESLEKQNAEITLICDELRERTMIENLNDTSRINETLPQTQPTVETAVDLQEEISKLQDQLQLIQTQCTEEMNKLKLDTLQQLEQSEEIYRENFRKCKTEWEENKQQYEEANKHLQIEKDKLKTRLDENTTELQRLKVRLEDYEEDRSVEIERISSEMNQMINEQIDKKKVAEEKLDVLTEKIEDLSANYEEANQKAKQYHDLFEEHEETKLLLSDANKSKEDLIEKVEHLERQVLQYQTDLTSQTNKMEELQTQLSEALESKSTESSELAVKVKAQKAALLQQAELFERESREMQNAMGEIQLKLASLKQDKSALTDSNDELKLKLKEALGLLDNEKSTCNALRTAISALESLNAELQRQVESLDKLRHTELEATSIEGKKIESLLENERSAAEALRQRVQMLEECENDLKSKLDSLYKEKAELETQRNQELQLCQEQKREIEVNLESERSKNESLCQQNQQLQSKFDSLHQEKHELEGKLSNTAMVQSSLHEECEVLRKMDAEHQSRLSAMEQEKRELEFKMADVQSTHETQLEEERSVSNSLRKELKTLEEVNEQQEAKLEDQKLEITRLHAQVIAATEKHLHLEKVHMGNNQQMLVLEDVKVQFDSMRTEYERVLKDNRSLSQQNERLQQIAKEMQLKIDNLLREKSQLENRNKEQTMKLAAAQKTAIKLEELQSTCTSLRQQNDKLNDRSTGLANNNAALIQQIEQLREEIKLLVCKENDLKAHKERLDGTIDCLLDEKRVLGERVCHLEEIIGKLEAEQKMKGTNGCNNSSIDSNDSMASSVGATNRRSLDHNVENGGRKSWTGAELRRSRRINIYDDRRKSSFISDSIDIGIMTDPVDANCNCAVLDSKLKDCQRSLFIAESQVTALNIELKNHPLKEENALLKKRIQEEQEKSRAEVKRLKQKNLDLISKVNTLNINLNEAVSTIKTTTTTATPATTTTKGQQLATSGTQTESSMESAFNKLSVEHKDALILCRHRFKIITDLREQLRSMESGTVSSQTAGQITTLHAQCESLQKQLANLNSKYDQAKRVLKLRRQEILDLREIADKNDNNAPPTSSSSSPSPPQS